MMRQTRRHPFSLHFHLLGAGLLLLTALPAAATTATLAADAHVSSALPDVNFGTVSNLVVGSGYTTLLQFDLGPLPAGTSAAQISRATLRLYVNRVDTAGVLSLAAVQSLWGEYTVTYTGLPVLGGSTSVLPVDHDGAFVVFDVTAIVQGWVAAPRTNFGVALSAGAASLQLDAKENDLTGHAAELEITLATTSAAGQAGVQGPAGPAGPIGPAGVPGPAGTPGPTGPAGATGTQGPAGLAGPAGPQGAAAVMNYQGLWSSLTTYPANAVVAYAGSSYLSLLSGNRGNTPALSSVAWGLLAAAGQNGVGASSTGTQGNLSYQGTYAAATNYGAGEIVQYGGSSFVSLTASNLGNTPGFSPSAWGLLAAAQTGPAGVAGPAGPTGPTGAQGIAGPAGAQGVAGPPGAIGAQGTPGLTYHGNYSAVTNYALGDIVLWHGITYTSLSGSNHGNAPDLVTSQWGVLATQGPTGIQGPQGDPGPIGLQGYPGQVGPPGPAGPTGAIGIQGPAGAQGLTGPQGARGDAGAQGLQGLAGTAGAQGIPGSVGAQGPQGPAGPQGSAGPAGLSPQGVYDAARNYALADSVTFNGSGYVSLATSNVGHTPDASPVQWMLFAAAGAAGPAGSSGPAGAAGSSGPQGAAGPSGAAGPQGARGAQGPAVANYTGNYRADNSYAASDAVSYQGSTYISLTGQNLGNTPDANSPMWAVLAGRGLAGATGATGSQGPSGQAGSQGAAGETGATGPQGQRGSAGPPGINYRGTWTDGLSYQINDAVSWQGSTWIAIVSSVSVQPGSAANAWSLLATAGATGPSGPTGTVATIMVGSVTTGSPGTAASVTNSGTNSAAVLNFTIPAGASGPAGTGGGSGGSSGTSGIPAASVIHSVNFTASFYSVNGVNAASTETAATLTWLPNGCSATRLAVYSMQAGTLTVTLRTGVPGSMQPSALSCSVATNSSCTATGNVTVAAGSFVNLNITGSTSSAASVWTMLTCD